MSSDIVGDSVSRSLKNVPAVPAKSSDKTESGSPTNVTPPAVLVRLSVKVIGEALACPTTKIKAREHSHTFARRPVLEDKAFFFGFVGFIETPACTTPVSTHQPAL
jgi:hypothetical protein